MVAERYHWPPEVTDRLPLEFAENLAVMIRAWGEAARVAAGRNRPAGVAQDRSRPPFPGSMAG